MTRFLRFFEVDTLLLAIKYDLYHCKFQSMYKNFAVCFRISQAWNSFKNQSRCFLVLRSSSLIKSMAYLASSVTHGVPSILRGLVATCLSPSKQQPLILSITSFPLFETRLMIFSFIYCIFKSRYLDVDLFFTLCLCGNLGVCFVAEQQNNDIDKG